MQSYPLDLKTLLHLLSRKHQSGQLYARKVKIAHVKESLQAHLTLIDGEVKSCLLATKSNNIYADEAEAFQILMQAGVIEWEWHESHSAFQSPPAAPLSQPAPPPVQEVPRRRNTLPLQGSLTPRRAIATNETFNALSRSERKILVLMDGSRTIYEIAGMLSLHEREELLNVLRELHRKGLIYFQ